MSTRRRCAQSRLQKALRYDPQLYLFAETATTTSVDDLKAVFTLTVTIDVHTRSQLCFRTSLKAAFRVCVRYLRDLTRKAERGEFSLGPMLMALVRGNNVGARKVS